MWKKNIILYLFSDFWRKTFGTVVTTAFYVSMGFFWGKIIFWKKFVTIIGLLAKIFRTIGENALAGLSKLHSRCPEERSEEKHYLWRKIEFMVILGLWAKKLGLLGKKPFGTVVKAAFYMSKKTLRKNFFWKKCNFIIIIWFWAKNYQTFGYKFSSRAVINAFYESKRTFYGLHFFPKMN